MVRPLRRRHQHLSMALNPRSELALLEMRTGGIENPAFSLHAPALSVEVI
jgi:hypothetical protein